MKKFIFLDMIKRLKEDDINGYAAQITFYLLLSIFPFLLFIMILLSHTLLLSNLNALEFSNVIPDYIYYFIFDIVSDVTTHQTDTLLSFSVILTVWSAAKGVRGIIKGMNQAYKAKESRSIILLFAMSFFYTIALAAIIILSVALIVFGNKLGKTLFIFLKLPWLYLELWNVLRFVIPIFFMLLIFVLIYKATPNKNLKIKEVYPGAIFSTLSSLAASQIFSYYIDHYADFSLVYGSIGSIIALVLWLYLISIIMMLGGELNASLSSYCKTL